MGQTYDKLDQRLVEWIERQPVFFVATAPLSGGGHVNLSPKGLRGTFAVLGPTSVAWLDFVGSGIETAAHLKENGRIVVMFCAFEGPPKILRLHGMGQVVEPSDPEFASMLERFPLETSGPIAERTIVVVEIHRIADSCGHGVPLLRFLGDRDQHPRWLEQKEAKEGASWKTAYVGEKNVLSIDGLPGIDAAQFAPPPDPSSS